MDYFSTCLDETTRFHTTHGKIKLMWMATSNPTQCHPVSPVCHPVSPVWTTHRAFSPLPTFQNQSLFFIISGFPTGIPQCVSDLRPFSIRRRTTSIPLLVLILLIQPCVLLRLMFLGWYSMPLLRVRICWYWHGSCWNNPEPSACEESGPHLEIKGDGDVLDAIQLLNNLRWEVAGIPALLAWMLLIEKIY